MPRAGVSARADARHAAPWWEELDREAFRFPAVREVRTGPKRAVTVRPGEVRPGEVRDAEHPAPVAAAPAAPAPTTTADGPRRTVIIRGYGAERNLPVARPTLRRHEWPGIRPDRAALWAVLLGLCLILVAAASAHRAVLH